MVTNAGKGHLFGRDIVYQPLAPESLIVGEGGEVKELPVGSEDQVLSVKNGVLTWAQVGQAPANPSAANLGTGERVFKNISGPVINFRTLKMGDGILLTENPEEIIIQIDTTFLSSQSTAGKLGTPTDGSLTDSRIPGCPPPAVETWTQDTLVVDAVDDLNEILGLLIPPPPALLSEKTIDLTAYQTSRSGDNILLSTQTPDNSNGGTAPVPGSVVKTIGQPNFISTTVESFGPGNDGELQAVINNLISGFIALDAADNSGTNDSIEILRDQDFPAGVSCFHQDLDARVRGMSLPGINRFSMNHTVSGETDDVFFVYDDVNIVPAINNLTVRENATTTRLTSGIPHYIQGSILEADFEASNLSGKTYLARNVVQIQAPGNTTNLSPGANGLPPIFPVMLSPQNLTSVEFSIGNTTYRGPVKIRGRNTFNDGPFRDSAIQILTLSSGDLDECVPVSVGTLPGGANPNACRIQTVDGDTPSRNVTLLQSDWNGNNGIQPYDAAWVANRIRHDRTNYAVGYLPVGPDLSSHNSSQYIEFMFRRSTISKFTININGSYSGLWITMTDVNFGSAPNNWLDMFKLYTGAGVPGLNGSNGCANGAVATGGSGSFGCTFGPETSSNATNNIILVRFRLDSGDAINSLSFTP